MPTIATMFNSRLPPHSIAGNTTKTVQSSYLEDGFPTNGQAKELPLHDGYVPGIDDPRNNLTLRLDLCQHKAGLPLQK